MIKKWKQRQQLAKYLKDHGKNLEEINTLLEQWGRNASQHIAAPHNTHNVYVRPQQDALDGATEAESKVNSLVLEERLPHCDMNTWYLDGVKREQAEELLIGKPTVTTCLPFYLSSTSCYQ